MSPDGSTKPLPEEKLLKLIREKAARPESQPPVPAGAAAGVGFSLSEAAGRAPEVRWPVLAAGGLGAVLLLELAYLAIQLIRPVPTVPVVIPESQAAAQAGEGGSTPLDVPSLAQSASPTLFVSPVSDSLGTPSPQTQSPRRGPSETAKLLASRLTLMGIVAGQSPQAIIEDAQTKKSYFVTVGQPVAEGAMVDQILDNRVILDLEGEKIELTL